MSGLEVIGLLFCLYLFWSITSALFNLFYTCYLGNALGRSLNVKTLGTWAGEFIGLDQKSSSFFFSLWVIPTVLLFLLLFLNLPLVYVS